MHPSKRRPQIIFFIIGALLLVVAFLILDLGGDHPSEILKFWSGAILSLAFILLTVVVVDVLWQVLGGEPIAETLKALNSTLAEMRAAVLLLQDSKNTGLYRAFSASGAFGNHRDWMQRLQESRSSIDLMGYSLHVWTRGERFEDELVKLVKSGVCVRILIMDETNPNLTAMINHQQISALSVNSVVEEIKVAKTVFRGIATTLATTVPMGSFVFRVLKKGLIVTQICRMDSRLTAVQYLHSVVASRSPLVDIRGAGTELFDVYLKEFDSLWALAE